MENYTWKIGNFATGNIIDSLPLYVIDSPEIDISVDNEDSAEIKILMTPYSDDIKNNWASYFKEVLHFCVAIGEESGDVLWAGMINKITPSISEQTLSFQLVNPKEYTSARIVGEKFGDVVEDPTAGVEITGASYSEIIAELVRRCFAPIDRANTPQPPNILLGALPAKTSEEKKMTFLYSDMFSYAEAIDNAIEESGLDIETRYDAFWANAEKTQVKWQFKCGSEVAPHINESSSLSIELRDAENIRKISEFENLVDSTELFNSFYISSKQGDEEAKNGMDLKNAVNYSSDFPILLETYYSPGVELSETQLNAQLSSYSNQGMNTKRTGSITLELESEDFILWAFNYLGRVITFTGFDNTLSAGYSTALRCVGVRFDLASGRVLIDLMNKQPRYPKLPRKKGKKSKKKTDSKKISPSNKLVKAKDVAKFKGGGTTPTPVPPWNPGGTYPPSDAGPGGQWGTGSETVKDDNNPYEISNYEKAWGVSFKKINSTTSPSSQITGAQNLSNVVVTVENYGKTYTWPANFVGVRTVSNSTTPNESLNLNMGSGYLSDGDIVNYLPSRNSINANNLIDDLALNHRLWGIEPPQEMVLSGYYYDYINTSSIGLSHATLFIVRDNIFLASTLTFTSNYKRRDSTAINPYSQKYTVFTKRKMLAWDQFGELEMIRNATISQGNNTTDNVIRSSRVGDYALISTINNIYVNNFSNYESVNSGNWYTLPLMSQIAGFTTTSEIIIGSVIVGGVRQSYLIKQSTGSGYKVFGLKLIGDNQPFAVHDDVWEDISHLFPFPTTSPSGTFCKVSSISGFLVASISSTTAREEFYMQDDTGNWRIVGGVNVTHIVGTGWNQSPPITHYQFGNWIYRIWDIETNPRAFHLRKIANWALPPSGTATTTMTLSSDEIASNNMVSEGGSSF